MGKDVIVACDFASREATLNFLDKHSNLHGMKNAEIAVTPNYISEEIKTDVKLGFSTSLGGILGVAIRAGFAFLIGWFKIKPTVPPEIERAAREAQAKLNPPPQNTEISKKKSKKTAKQKEESKASPTNGEDKA